MTLASSSPTPQELGTLRNPDTGDISHSFIHEHHDPFTCCIYMGLVSPRSRGMFLLGGARAVVVVSFFFFFCICICSSQVECKSRNCVCWYHSLPRPKAPCPASSFVTPRSLPGQLDGTSFAGRTRDGSLALSSEPVPFKPFSPGMEAVSLTQHLFRQCSFNDY